MGTRLIAQQNADFDLVVTYKDANGNPINLTGWTSAMMVRAAYADKLPALSLTDGNGLTLGGSAGTITIHIPYSDTANLTAPKNYVYDVRLVNGSNGEAYRVLEGDFVVTPAVTR